MPQTTKLLVSGIAYMDRREILPKIFDVQNEIGLTDVMGAFGRYKPADMFSYHNFVNVPLWTTATVDTGAVTGTGTPTIAPVLIVASSGNRRKNDLVNVNGKVARVTNVTTASSKDTVTMTSVDGTNLTCTAADKLKFFSNTVGESSISRPSQFFSATKYYNLIQIFRENHDESDVQKLSQVEVEFKGQKYYFVKEHVEKFIKLKGEVNAAMIQGQISAAQFDNATALTDPDGGGQTQTTRGLDQYVSSYGVPDALTTLGTFITADFEDYIDLLIAKRTGKNYSMVGASAPIRKVDVWAKMGGTNAVQSARLQMDGKSVDYEIDNINFGGFNFQKYNMPILDHPDLFGGTTPGKSIYFIPNDKVKVLDDTTGRNSYEPRIQIRYKKVPSQGGINGAGNVGNDVWLEGHTGLLSPINPNGDKANWATSWLTYQGLEILGAEHFGRLQVTA